MSHGTGFSPGDVFLLFEAFRFAFDKKLPLPLGPCVYLNETPHSILQSADPPALADFVLPGYHLPPPKVACCLRCSVSETLPLEIEPSVLFFNTITALHLRLPSHIHVAGQFEFGGQDFPLGKKPGLFYLRSLWWPDTNPRYNSEDIRSADKIARRQIEIVEHKFKKLISAHVLYFQATFSNFFQPAYLLLFASLEALFPQKNKPFDKTLARRVSSFLSNVQFPFPVADWLKKEYNSHRGNLAHGNQDVMPWSKLSQEEREAFSRLHELTRLAILGFMSLENDVLEKLSRKNGNSLQNELENLPVANGEFLQGQKPFCA